LAKGYMVSIYRSVSDPAALAEYAKLAAPALLAAGGRFVVRGTAAKVYEKGLMQRTVIIEFDSLEKAIAAYESPQYKEALKVLGNAAERDIRMVEGAS
jgi:uncharacterized protein (DUF1330 family)